MNQQIFNMDGSFKVVINTIGQHYLALMNESGGDVFLFSGDLADATDEDSLVLSHGEYIKYPVPMSQFCIRGDSVGSVLVMAHNGVPSDDTPIDPPTGHGALWYDSEAWFDSEVWYDTTINP